MTNDEFLFVELFTLAFELEIYDSFICFEGESFFIGAGNSAKLWNYNYD